MIPTMNWILSSATGLGNIQTADRSRQLRRRDNVWESTEESFKRNSAVYVTWHPHSNWQGTRADLV